MMTSSTVSRAWLPTLAVAATASFMASLDNLVVTTALPRIRADLGASLESLTWIVNAYTLSYAVFMLVAAILGDRFGRRTVFVGGLALFTLASAAAGLAPSVGALTAARAVQGLGGSVIFPLGLTLVVQVAPAARRGLAIAGLSIASGAAIALGPLVGGVIVQHAPWQLIFWINVPVGLVLVPLIRRHVAQSRGPRGRLDLLGLALLTVGLSGVVFGLVRAADRSWQSPQVTLPLGVGAALLVAFLVWESRTPAPVVPLRLFRDRGFSAANAIALLAQAGMFGSVFFITQFLQEVLDYAPAAAGLRTLPWTVMPLLVAPLSAVLANRFGVRPLMILSCVLQGGSLVWFAAVATPSVPFLAMLPAMVIGGTGMGLFFGLNARQALDFTAPAQEGIAAGVNSALRQVGVVFGIAVLSAVFAATGAEGPPTAFVTGFRAVLLGGAAMLALALLCAVAVPRAGRAAPTPEPAGATGREMSPAPR